MIEVGAGHGLNFAFHPAVVERVPAVEPEPLLRGAAIEAAAKAAVEVEVVEGSLATSPPPMCPSTPGSPRWSSARSLTSSAPSQSFVGVIRPGGTLRFYEPVIAHPPRWARVQRFADATFWPRVAGGCHLSRDTEAAIEQAGFEIQASRRFGFSPGPPVPAIPHVLGVARRP